MIYLRKIALSFFFFQSITLIGQIHVLTGTTLTVASGTTLSLNNSLSDTLKVDSGAQLVNNGKIVLSPSVIITEEPGFPVTGLGYEEYSNLYLSPVSGIDPGGLGFTLSTVIAPDSFQIKRFHSALSNAGMNSVLRSYEIISQTNSGLGGSAIFNYDITELNGHNYNNLMLYQSSNGGASWNVLNGSAYSNNVQSLANSIDSLSLFSLFSFDFQIDSINALTFYHGDSIKIYYTLNGVLNPGNILNFEFSDTVGNFSVPFVLDAIPAINGSGVLTKAIPALLDPGTGYRLRLQTTNLPLISADNGNDITILDPLTTSVNENSHKEKYQVYPNPTNGTLYIKGNNINKITVTDKFGRVVLGKVSINQNILMLDVSNLPSAVYIIAIETSDRTSYQKFIKN